MTNRVNKDMEIEELKKLRDSVNSLIVHYRQCLYSEDVKLKAYVMRINELEGNDV